MGQLESQGLRFELLALHFGWMLNCWCHQYHVVYVFVILVANMDDLWNDIDLINFGSVLNDYVCMDSCYCEVVVVCWSSLVLFKGFIFSNTRWCLEWLLEPCSEVIRLAWKFEWLWNQWGLVNSKWGESPCQMERLQSAGHLGVSYSRIWE